MIDTKKFYIVDPEGYEDRSIAECKIQLCYRAIPGVKVQYDAEDGQHYIVQKRKKSKRK